MPEQQGLPISPDEVKTQQSNWKMNEEERFPGLSVREAIEKAIEEEKQKTGEIFEWYWYFANFCRWLPGGENREHPIIRKRWNTPNGVYFAEKGRDTKGHSQLFLQQSPGEVIETIDTVLAEQNIPVEQVLAIQERRSSKRSDAEESPIKQLYELTIPAYIALRERGYTRSELIT